MSQAQPPCVSEWASASLHFTPDKIQSQILDSPAHRLILLCTRQFGKSTLAAIIPEEMFEVLTGSLAANDGNLWLISSAGPQFGFFYDQWHNNELPWQRFKVTARECRRISPEFLEHERLVIGESAFRGEYLCEFAAAGHQIFSRELIESITKDDLRPWNDGKPLCN